jgi:hypothetical protein
VSAFCLLHFGDELPNFFGLGFSRIHDGLSMLGRRVAVHGAMPSRAEGEAAMPLRERTAGA